MGSNSMLASLPPDVLVYVTSHLSGFDLGRLFLCGSLPLNLSLCQRGGVKSFILTFERPYALYWPSIAASFQHLETFKLVTTLAATGCVIERCQIAQLPYSLKSVELDFQNALSALFHLRGDSNSPWSMQHLSDLWPKLHTLRYFDGYGGYLHPKLIPLLPRSLTHLTLHNGVYDPDIISLLPTNLVSLDISLMQDIKDQILPATLSSLYLRGTLTSRVLEHIPISVTDLLISCSNSFGAWRHLQASEWNDFDLFPPALTRLDVHWVGSGVITPRMIEILSRDLISLQLSLMLPGNDEEKKNCFANLPPKLTSLHLRDSDVYTTIPIQADASNNSTSVALLEDIIGAKNLKDVSPALHNYFADLMWFPRNLTLLQLAMVTKRITKVLPEALETLRVANFVEADQDTLADPNTSNKILTNQSNTNTLDSFVDVDLESKDSENTSFSSCRYPYGLSTSSTTINGIHNDCISNRDCEFVRSMERWTFPKNLTCVSAGTAPRSAIDALLQLPHLTSLSITSQLTKHPIKVSEVQKSIQRLILDKPDTSEFDSPLEKLDLLASTTCTSGNSGHSILGHLSELSELDLTWPLSGSITNFLRVLPLSKLTRVWIQLANTSMAPPGSILKIFTPTTSPVLLSISLVVSDLCDDHLSNLPRNLQTLNIFPGSGSEQKENRPVPPSTARSSYTPPSSTSPEFSSYVLTEFCLEKLPPTVTVLGLPFGQHATPPSPPIRYNHLPYISVFSFVASTARSVYFQPFLDDLYEKHQSLQARYSVEWPDLEAENVE